MNFLKVKPFKVLKNLLCMASQTGWEFLDKIVALVAPTPVVQFLNTVLYRNPLILLNYWSFVHLFAGIIFYLLFPKKFKLWVIINVVFEIVEYLLSFGGNPLFVEESIDIILDIVWSLGGFLAAKYLKEKGWKYLKKNL